MAALPWLLRWAYSGLQIANNIMDESFKVGDRVRVYFDAKFGEKEGWYQGTVFKIDPYSEHRSFYWVELDKDIQVILGIKQISIFNLKNIKKAS